MKFVFSVKKYKEWRMSHEKLDEDTIDWIIANQNYQARNGIDRDELCRKGHIILEQWCDEINESEKN